MGVGNVTLGKDPVPILQEAGWVGHRAAFGGCGKSHLTGIRSPDLQPVVNRYTNWAIPAQSGTGTGFFFFQVLQFSAVSIIPPLLYTYVPLYYQRHTILVIRSLVKQNTSLISLHVTFYHNTNFIHFIHCLTSIPLLSLSLNLVTLCNNFKIRFLFTLSKKKWVSELSKL
jgi:hypothetical protein